MKRYDLAGEYYFAIEPMEDGDYVLYSDLKAHDDAIRRECAKKVEKLRRVGTMSNSTDSWFTYGNEDGDYIRRDEVLAILGDKPARESSRAISFDGWFYVFTDPTTGATKSYSSYKNAAAAFDKILGTEPAREES